MEIEEKVYTRIVDRKCDECQEGRMRPLGQYLPCDPPKFWHQCNKCSFKEYYLKKYPLIRYRNRAGEILDTN